MPLSAVVENTDKDDGDNPSLSPPSVEGQLELATDERYVAAIRFNNLALPDYYDLVTSEDGAMFLPIEPIFRAGEASVIIRENRLELVVPSNGNSLILDQKLQDLEINGVHRPLTEAVYRYVDGNFLVADKVVEEAFQLQSKFNASTQELHMTSARPFPRDLRIARERLWDGLNNTETLKVPVHLQLQDYSLLGSPQADISLNGQFGSESDATGSWHGLVVSEALYLTHHLNIGGDLNEPLQNIRLRSGRMSPTGNVFGISPLYEAQFGDISGMRMPLVGSGGNGRGMVLQASPLGRAKNFDKTLIEGDAPPGWDAELYLGVNLLNFQRIGENGRYKFDDVPLEYGNNDLKVVLYGPQGQVREEVYREQIGGAMVPPGEVQGSVYVIEDGLQLFGDEESSEANASGLWAGGGKVDIGVLQHLTVGLFAAHSPVVKELAPIVNNDLAAGLFAARSSVDEEGVSTANKDFSVSTAANDYYGMELRPSLGSLLLETGAAAREQGGYATYSRFALPLYSMSLSAGYQYYDQEYTAKENEDGLVSSKTALRLGIPLGPKELRLGSLGVSFEDLQRWNSEPEKKTSLTYAHQLGFLFFGHQADFNWRGEGIDLEEATGLYTMRSSYRLDLFDIRGEMRFGLNDESSLQSINVSALWRKDATNRIYTTVSYSPEDNKTSYGVGWSRDLGLAALSLNASAGDDRYACGLGLTFSFGHTPARGFNVSSRSRAMMGLADLHIFEDHDADGEFTPEKDKSSAGASVLLNRRPLEIAADNGGRIGIDSLSINDPMEISVNTDSLPDSFLVPMYTAVQSWPRPGQAVEIKIPVTEAGEISGIVKIAAKVKVGGKANGTNGQKGKSTNGDNNIAAVTEKIVERPLSGIRLQVINSAGQLHAEVFTFSDGYFLFDNVYPGSWTVQVAPDQDYRGIRLSSVELKVDLSAQQRVVNSLNINFQSDGKVEQEGRNVIRIQDIQISDGSVEQRITNEIHIGDIQITNGKDEQQVRNGIIIGDIQII